MIGEAITDDQDWARWLNRKAGKFVQINFHDPKTNAQYQEVVKPIDPNMESEMLRYNAWTKRMEFLTDSLSKGNVGYIHVRDMDDPSFRVTFDKVLGRNIDKGALIVDTRFNGGGWLHDDLATFLSGKEYLTLRPQSNKTLGGESLNKWTKPSCVLMSQCNYSDAFPVPICLPRIKDRQADRHACSGYGHCGCGGKTQIDNTIYFGIPMVATYGMNETHATENHQLEPDIKVNNDYVPLLSGEDQQLEAAVKEMLSEINK